MQIIYSYIEPWIIDQSVYIMSDKDTEPVMYNKVPLENLPDYLTLTYTEKNCDKIILHGSTYVFTEEIAEQIKNSAITNYNLNNINIEVVK